MLARGVLHARRERQLLHLHPIPGVLVMSPSIDAHDNNHADDNDDDDDVQQEPTTERRKQTTAEAAGENVGRGTVNVSDNDHHDDNDNGNDDDSDTVNNHNHIGSPAARASKAPPSKVWLNWSVLISGLPKQDYAEACFRLQLTFDEESPAVPPRVQFLTIPYHPNVHPVTGLVCMPTLERWNQPQPMQAAPPPRTPLSDHARARRSITPNTEVNNDGDDPHHTPSSSSPSPSRAPPCTPHTPPPPPPPPPPAGRNPSQRPANSYVELLRDVQRLLSKPHLPSAVNAPAANLYRFKRDAYQRFVQQCSEASLRVHAGLPPYRMQQMQQQERLRKQRQQQQQQQQQQNQRASRPTTRQSQQRPATQQRRLQAVPVHYEEYRASWKITGSTRRITDGDSRPDDFDGDGYGFDTRGFDTRGYSGRTHNHERTRNRHPHSRTATRGKHYTTSTASSASYHNHRNSTSTSSSSSGGSAGVRMWPHPAARQNLLQAGSAPGSRMGRRVASTPLASARALRSAPVISSSPTKHTFTTTPTATPSNATAAPVSPRRGAPATVVIPNLPKVSSGWSVTSLVSASTSPQPDLSRNASHTSLLHRDNHRHSPRKPRLSRISSVGSEASRASTPVHFPPPSPSPSLLHAQHHTPVSPRPMTSRTDAEADDLISWAGRLEVATPFTDDTAQSPTLNF
ncbi:hypothetical protein PTSG_00639 [Salpingoeca rosetta]|uniref:UBC core domain-containing protein n=1 Tax=Salpingoeca rosetta (strain ATCC 50818 / BSB-021) TaxID=946362 RepID=F2TX23_SALR5|nr:uncharacterized protein PTSG_00639 [Salpingoeca rosetta]EGD75932.1 hypothetical protein PTSG_00639 [Salpingoeca rosetta]|eukprot:XP_004998108.1 hypothetical protein PTSG_00639 [Salpingoeca rosetta]